MRLGKNIFQAAFFRSQVQSSSFKVSGSKFQVQGSKPSPSAIVQSPCYLCHAERSEHLYTSAVGRCVIIHFLDADDADDADFADKLYSFGYKFSLVSAKHQ